VSDGENYDEAAKRELHEELGISVPLEKLLKISASPQAGQEFIWLYRGQLRGKIRPNCSEIENGAFVAPAVVDGWTVARPENFAPGFLQCWQAYRRRESG